jgi:hypothetical protein
MKIWQSVKDWFNDKQDVKPIEEKRSSNIRPIILEKVKRKTRDNVKLTKKQIIIIRNLYKYKEDYNVSTYAEFTKFCNNELDINKSRSVYHRIIHKDGGYAPVNKG